MEYGSTSVYVSCPNLLTGQHKLAIVSVSMLSQPHITIDATFISTVNPKGRLTLPIEVRRTLHIQPDDKIVFRVREGTVSIEGKLPSLEELAGSVTPLQPRKELTEVIREAKEEHTNDGFVKK